MPIRSNSNNKTKTTTRNTRRDKKPRIDLLDFIDDNIGISKIVSIKLNSFIQENLMFSKLFCIKLTGGLGGRVEFISYHYYYRDHVVWGAWGYDSGLNRI